MSVTQFCWMSRSDVCLRVLTVGLLLLGTSLNIQEIAADEIPENAQASVLPVTSSESTESQIIDVNPIVIDGKFDDWKDIPAYTDPPQDTNDTEPRDADDEPMLREHVDADLLQYSVIHDAEALYFYMRSRGQIGRTQVGNEQTQKSPGRYYVIITIDVDQNDETGYWLHEGGYFPTSRGYDVNAELEFYNGTLHVAKYLNHGAASRREVWAAYQDQSNGQHSWKNIGPHAPGFIQFKPGYYDFYTEWVYHPDDTIQFVRDKGRKLGLGIVTYALSEDEHQIEMRFPFKGFLKDPDGMPLIGIGSVIDISMSLEASGEFAPSKRWASDTGEPIKQYKLSNQGEVDQ